MQEIKVLIRDADDWREVYVDGKLIYEGHDNVEAPSLRILEELKQYGFEMDFRIIFLDFGNVDTNDIDKTPLHCFTGENYWSDWARSEPFVRN